MKSRANEGERQNRRRIQAKQWAVSAISQFYVYRLQVPQRFSLGQTSYDVQQKHASLVLVQPQLSIGSSFGRWNPPPEEHYATSSHQYSLLEWKVSASCFNLRALYLYTHHALPCNRSIPLKLSTTTKTRSSHNQSKALDPWCFVGKLAH